MAKIGVVSIYQCGGCNRLSTEQDYCCGRLNGRFTFPVYAEED